MYVPQTIRTDEEWIDLPQVRDKWLAGVKTATKPRVLHTSLRKYQLVKQDSTPQDYLKQTGSVDTVPCLWL
jgi:hypothetical protein